MTLTISMVALLLFIRARPVVSVEAEQVELATLTLDAEFLLRRELQRNNWNRLQLEEVVLDIDRQASAIDARIIIVVDNRDQTVVFDSDGGYPRDNLAEEVTREPLFGRPRDSSNPVLIAGEFVEDGSRWIYAERRPVLSTIVPNNDNFRVPVAFIFARPYPKPTLREAVEEVLGSGLFFVILQAGIIGMVFAIILSVGIVRWVSRPLNHLANAAEQLAEGDYTTRTQVTGPRETKIVARAFNNMAGRVALTQQAQRDFLANVSHDLRTPLTSIQGFAQAISEGVAEPKAADVIYNEASRMHRMVEELLDLARIQAGRMDMLRQAVELDTLLRTVGQNMSMKAHKHGVELEVSIPDLPRIAGNGDRLAQVFTNLVDNAIKHTPEGGHVTLRSMLDHERNGIIIQIQDSGEGIPPADLPRIFERFYQVDKSRAKSDGSGLGLAITYEIVSAHNGEIWVESSYGMGATFNVWLPQPIGDSGKTVIIPRRR
ncbi:MAG: HAMP domain-containing histidine kinase [Chloroflexi bacterium]|nr:HAMP domain-containing histidine kinase [Chloroflexota bacterium]